MYRIRRASAVDTDELVRLNAELHGTSDRGRAEIGSWTRDLLTGHPTVAPEDFLIAEAPGGTIAATLVEIRQTWRCGAASLPVVQVELVGTAPEHRGNALTGALLDVVHRREGVALHAIEGIAHFYRHFGYDYGLVPGGAPLLPVADIPDPDGPVSVRRATGADAAELAAIDHRRLSTVELFCPRTEAQWRYEFARHPESLMCQEIDVISAAGATVGYAIHSRWSGPAGVLHLFPALTDPRWWPQATAAVLAHLRAAGAEAVHPHVEADHPLIRHAPRTGAAQRRDEWYTRAADPTALLRAWLPALRDRLSGIDWPHPTLRIDTYHAATDLCFDGDGTLHEVRPAPRAHYPARDEAVHAAIPPGALVELALGQRTIDEAAIAWPDLRVRGEAATAALAAAFPRIPVHLWPFM